MDDRDYFAAVALHALVADSGTKDDLARAAYDVAELMIAERGRRNRDQLQNSVAQAAVDKMEAQLRRVSKGGL